MSKTVYIARNAQILASLTEDEYSDGVIRCAGPRVARSPYHVETPVDEWESNAVSVFSEYARIVGCLSDWEYHGSSPYELSEQQESWVVAVYESPFADFAGDQLDALVEHPRTVLHGYVRFVDQGARYSNAVIDLADLAEICPASRIDKLRIAVGDLLDESREHNAPTDDIRDALRGSDWDYVDGDVVLRVPEAA